MTALLKRAEVCGNLVVPDELVDECAGASWATFVTAHPIILIDSVQ
jgi:hypothetical protein